jgi:hypothetical protein
VELWINARMTGSSTPAWNIRIMSETPVERYGVLARALPFSVPVGLLVIMMGPAGCFAGVWARNVGWTNANPTPRKVRMNRFMAVI